MVGQEGSCTQGDHTRKWAAAGQAPPRWRTRGRTAECPREENEFSIQSHTGQVAQDTGGRKEKLRDLGCCAVLGVFAVGGWHKTLALTKCQ